jgi:hypothetical protein
MGTIQMYRNTQPGPTVFTDDVTKAHVEWKGADDPNSGDIQPVPDSFENNVQFHRAVRAGILERIDPEDADAILRTETDHREEWEARVAERQNAGRDVIEREQDNDVVVLDCIGPKGKTGELCAEPVAVKSKARFDKPPLCAKHSPLAGQFIPEETGRMVGSHPEITWSRPQMERRQRSQ